MKPVKPLLTVLAVVLGLSVGLAGGDAVQKDLKALSGTWVSKAGTVEEVSFTFSAGGEYTFGIPNEPPQKGRFAIDPSKRPRTLDLIDADGGKQLYIYEIRGNELTVAYDSGNAKRRPGRFSGNNVVVTKYKKAG